MSRRRPMDLVLTQDFDQDRESLWRSLTDSAALADWLMPNTFRPVVGATFELRAGPEDTDCGGTVRCRVLTLEPPHLMVWSWIEDGTGSPTAVSFTLTERGTGCRLAIRHRGLASTPEEESFRQGWLQKCAALEQHLGNKGGEHARSA
ncbi:SRPBCC family protein [Pelagibius sp.]|uniref:SRPBCC family protein n=1 Tax=Pelagibius sp. TaxID=1931238 RepID=UPI003B500FC5